MEGIWPFQAHVMLQQLNRLGSQWKETDLATFPVDAELCFRQQQIVAVESQDLLRSQALEQHQTDNGEVASSSKTGPESRHFVYRQRHDITSRRPYAQPAQGRSRTADSHGTPPLIDLVKARRELTGRIWKLIAQGPFSDDNAPIDAGRRRPGLLAGLEANVVR